jgi:hypothetical protein
MSLFSLLKTPFLIFASFANIPLFKGNLAESTLFLPAGFRATVPRGLAHTFWALVM